ncbi:MAG: hypothetical protein WCW26_02290 [Candidatus Buchananbacteria bacterium]
MNYFYVAVPIGVLLIAGLVSWLVWRKMTKPITPNAADQTSNDPVEWARLSVPYSEVVRLQNLTKIPLAPERLEAVAFEVNKGLRELGFDFQLTCHQMLGVLCNQWRLNQLGKAINVIDTSVWWEAERRIRQEDDMDRDEPIRKEGLEKRVSQMVEAAKANRQPASSEPCRQGNRVTASPQVAAAKSVKDLVFWQAHVMTCRALKLPSNTRKLPPQAKSEWLKQLNLAWQQYCQTRGLPSNTKPPF